MRSSPRCCPELKSHALKALTQDEVIGLLERALVVLNVQANRDILAQIALHSNGDARSAYNILELASGVAKNGKLDSESVESVLGRKMLLYDKAGEQHFNLISALHKSIRSSDPDAAVYWLARMLAMAAKTECTWLGDWFAWRSKISGWPTPSHGTGHRRPAGRALLGNSGRRSGLGAGSHLSGHRPKVRRAYKALNAAVEVAETQVAEPVPMHLRNAPTKAMKLWGYGEGYQHAHNFEGGVSQMECLPEQLRGKTFYEPTDRGVEQRITQRLAELRALRNPEK